MSFQKRDRFFVLVLLACLTTFALGASLSEYKGRQVVESAAESAGQALTNNFKEDADRIGTFETYVGTPSVNQDIDYSPTPAWQNSVWTESATDPLFWCRDNTNGAAVWDHIITEDPVTGDTVFLGNRMDVGTATDWSIGIGTGAGEAEVPHATNGRNIFIGRNAGFRVTTGGHNVFVGYESGIDVVTGADNTTLGYTAWPNGTGSRNLMCGDAVATTMTSGDNNVFLGREAGLFITDTSNTVLIGEGVMDSGTSNTDNVIIGGSAAGDMTTSSDSVVIGKGTAAGITTGTENTIIGANITGLSAVLSNNIILADGAGSQRLVIDNTGAASMGATTFSGTEERITGATHGQYFDFNDTGANVIDVSGRLTFTAGSGCIIPSGTSATPAVEGMLFLDTDAGTNGTLLMYSNGDWRTVQAF
jgi:hypothetical protein